MSLTGLFLAGQMLTSDKYSLEFSEEVVQSSLKRLTNQLWKLIPMRENNEPWKEQLASVLLEIAGMRGMYDLSEKCFTLFNKLQGLLEIDLEFKMYRKTIFECITLLHEVVR